MQTWLFGRRTVKYSKSWSFATRIAMLREVILSIFEPGVNRSTRFFTYGIFVSLILVIVALLVAVGFNIHLVFLLILSILLLLAIIW